MRRLVCRIFFGHDWHGMVGLDDSDRTIVGRQCLRCKKWEWYE